MLFAIGFHYIVLHSIKKKASSSMTQAPVHDSRVVGLTHLKKQKKRNKEGKKNMDNTINLLKG